jgi:hypothetical protein|tara:strand:+ start:108 stop:1148 length:1041 start_codon:yes stop_codon:yes gene_type:complete
MNRKLIILLLFLPVFSFAQLDLKKTFKFSTFYGAINGGTSISSVDVFSVTNGLQTQTIETPYDYSISLGVRKIARFGYENKANTFYDGTESSFSDAATIGKVKGLEFLFEADYRRVQGVEYFDQHHFLRYVSANQWMAKVEYLKEGFADIEYFEASERYRFDVTKKLSINIGAAHRVAEPYGYDPLEEWKLSNGNLHYTYLALQEGYNVNVFEGEYYDPSGQVVATSSEIWEAVVIPQVLQDYTKRKKDELPAQWNHSLVLGFDYYQYSKTFWLHTWGSLMPYHYDDGNDYSYHKYEGKQWLDYSGGLIFGTKITKHLGTFVEGTYNKYWNRTWHDFKLGINYVIF